MINWQKIWQHFAWRNAPSTETPLSAETLQKLNDAIKSLDERVVELAGKAVTRDEIVNNLLATEPSTVLAGPMGKALDDKISRLNLDLGAVNSNLNIQKVSDANLAVPVVPFASTKYKTFSGLNAPVSGSHTFIIEAIGDSTTIFSQRAICVYTSTDVRILGNMYLRHCNNGTWTAWESCVTNTDLTTDGTVDNPVQGLSIIKSINGFTICRADGDYAVQLQLHWWDGLRIRVKTGGSWGTWTAK